jgi:hypothetical protein
MHSEKFISLVHILEKTLKNKYALKYNQIYQLNKIIIIKIMMYQKNNKNNDNNNNNKIKTSRLFIMC